MTNPVLVTGPDRSGTTLMFALLASHPRLSMSRRTNMWRWFYGRFGDLSERSNLEACLDMMLRYHRLAPLEPDRTQITGEFLRGPQTYGRLFSLFHEQNARKHGKPRWGDKSLHTEHFAEEILEELPQAKIIHMMRDPRDRYSSVSRRYENGSKGVGSIIGRWVVSTRKGDSNLAAFPENYRMIRYEDLATSPEDTLQEVCDFIGEDYHPAMLAMRGAPEHGNEGNSSFERIQPGVISTKSIGRWRDVLDPNDVSSIQTLAGRLMRAHGYAPEPALTSLSERLGFAFGRLPVDAARMTGWLLTYGRREREGGQIPRERLLDVPLDRGPDRASPASKGRGDS